MSRSKVLAVDDDPMLLQLYALQLGDEFDVEVAHDGTTGLQLLATKGPFAVVVADMHMPEMTGDEFLRRAETICPLTSRIMLTAASDQEVAVKAVNHGQVFRFLSKPSNEQGLQRAVREGCERNRLQLAEKELLSSTLNGSVALLCELLSTLKPLAFGRAKRIRRLVERLCEYLQVRDGWEAAIAASLSHIGCFVIPDTLLLKIEVGEVLTSDESLAWQSHPRLAQQLLSRIPRLERIAAIIGQQHNIYRSERDHPSECRGQVEWRAGLLRAAEDYDSSFQRSRDRELAIRDLRQNEGVYPRDVLDGLVEVMQAQAGFRSRRVCVCHLKEGMILDEDITDAGGSVLITSGQDVSEVLIVALDRRLSRGCAIREPILVREPIDDRDLEQHEPTEFPAQIPVDAAVKRDGLSNPIVEAKV